LFRYSNVASPAQVRELTDAIQAAVRRREGAAAPPVLIAADQEGGQLAGLGDGPGGPTAFAGGMALGAAGDKRLTERVGRAVGRELRAMGVTLEYAPVCDLASNPLNAAIGIRSFGDAPSAVAGHVAAFVRGVQSARVAAALKHFPGLGAVEADTHHGLAVLDADRDAILRHELVPFRAGIEAGARVVMSAHVAVPAVTGERDLPGTLAGAVMGGLLRDELGFEGVSITDALDMQAIPQGPGQVDAVLRALGAGVDLLLTAPDVTARERIEAGLRDAAAGGLLDERALRASIDRVAGLRRWLADAVEQPDIGVVGGAEHQALARELAARSLTLVRDDDGLLPLRLPAAARVAAIQPAPTDLTPADTSSAVPPGLAAALRRRFDDVDAFVAPHAPSALEIAALRDAVRDYDAIVVGTTATLLEPSQAALADAVLGLGRPTVTVALRAPFDLAAYPSARCHVAAYGILPPTLEALADALAGAVGFPGRLPAALPGLYATGHGLVR
jgi:beta-N-acetylhexosaminidase